MKAINKETSISPKNWEKNDNFSIAESNVLSLEEWVSSFDPQISLKNTSKVSKKSRKTCKNKPKTLRKTPVPGYYSALASDQSSSGTNDDEDEHSNTAPNLSDPAPGNTPSGPATTAPTLKAYGIFAFKEEEKNPGYPYKIGLS